MLSVYVDDDMPRIYDKNVRMQELCAPFVAMMKRLGIFVDVCGIHALDYDRVSEMTTRRPIPLFNVYARIDDGDLFDWFMGPLQDCFHGDTSECSAPDTLHDLAFQTFDKAIGAPVLSRIIEPLYFGPLLPLVSSIVVDADALACLYMCTYDITSRRLSRIGRNFSNVEQTCSVDHRASVAMFMDFKNLCRPLLQEHDVSDSTAERIWDAAFGAVQRSTTHLDMFQINVPCDYHRQPSNYMLVTLRDSSRPWVTVYDHDAFRTAFPSYKSIDQDAILIAYPRVTGDNVYALDDRFNGAVFRDNINMVVPSCITPAVRLSGSYDHDATRITMSRSMYYMQLIGLYYPDMLHPVPVPGFPHERILSCRTLRDKHAFYVSNHTTTTSMAMVPKAFDTSHLPPTVVGRALLQRPGTSDYDFGRCIHILRPRQHNYARRGDRLPKPHWKYPKVEPALYRVKRHGSMQERYLAAVRHARGLIANDLASFALYD